MIKFKHALLFLCALLSLQAFAQNDEEGDNERIKNLAPIEGKAIVYLMRPSVAGFAIKMNLECDSVHIGSTTAKRFVFTVLDPGKHVLVSKSENKSVLELTVDPGKVYYIKQEVKVGILVARTKLEQVDEEEGKKILAKCKLSGDNVYKSP